MFEYYTPVYSEEHCLYISEIAELYGIYSLAGKPHIKLVKALIDDYIKTQKRYNHIFYETSRGLRECYPFTIYDPSISTFLNRHSNLQSKELSITCIDEDTQKTYKYMIRKK